MAARRFWWQWAILDFAGDAALPEVGSQRSGATDLVFVVPVLGVEEMFVESAHAAIASRQAARVCGLKCMSISMPMPMRPRALANSLRSM